MGLQPVQLMLHHCLQSQKIDVTEGGETVTVWCLVNLCTVLIAALLDQLKETDDSMYGALLLKA